MRFKLLILVLFSVCIQLHAQLNTPPLERRITLHADNKTTEDIFLLITEKAQFEYSYANSAFDRNKITSLHVANVTVRRALDQLFENRVTYKVRGNHVVLLAAPAPLPVATAPPKKAEYKLSGYITDQSTGYILPDVSIVDTARIAAVISDKYGYYSLTIPAGKKPVNIRIKRTGYFDSTIAIIPSSNLTADIALRRIPPAEPIVYIPQNKADSISAFANHVADSTSAEFKRMRFEWANGLLSRAQRIQFVNLKDDVFKGKSQISLVPFVSTNGLLTGKTRNKFSFNIIAGYTGGTDVLEVGGVLNVDRGDVKNVQIAGAANVVIGKVDGVQAAGAFNIVTQQVNGMQLSGSGNFALDSMEGVQLSGAVNIVNGYMLGVQGSGAVNGVIGNMYGLQVGGTGNAVTGDIRGFQAGGWGNYAKNCRGLQIAGGMNCVKDTVSIMQLAGALNYADVNTGLQLSGIVNITENSCRGMQISGLYNYAGTLNGSQIGVINQCENYESGLILGFMSFVKNGVHQLEVSGDENVFLSAAFKTGIPRFYNIISAGRSFKNDQFIWSVGYGAGTRFNLNQKKTFRISIDYLIQHVNYESWSNYNSDWHQLKPMAEWAPSPKFSVAIGPTLNWYINQSDKNWFTPYIGDPFLDKIKNGNQHRLWIGASLAVRFL
ncbi:MAG: STN and carboxypeptidase regulatory-like domain-containing protein [Bacteroidota bacterium]|jgi:hypothetical protein